MHDLVGDCEVVATPEMCQYCFDTLLRELIPKPALPHHGVRSRSRSPSKRKQQTEKANDADIDGSGPMLMEWLEGRPSYDLPAIECPLFVTWSKRRSRRSRLRTSSSGADTPASTTASSSSGAECDDNPDDDSDHDLRGCIGTLSPRPLDRALPEFAVASALHDGRFDPVALREVPSLRAGVSLLVRHEECEDCFDWEVGVHGIVIKFRGGGASVTVGDYGSEDDRHHCYGATYLPEVAREQGWSRREAVTSLVRKAGYRGEITDRLLKSIRCTRYQSSKCRLSYEEYVASCAGGGGTDPLEDAGMMMAAADEAMRQRTRGARPCINL